MANIDHFLQKYDIKFEVAVEPYELDYSRLNFKCNSKFNERPDGINDELIECTECLVLTFVPKYEQESTVIRIILTKASYIVLECDSPLIGQYCCSSNPE